MVRLDSVQLVSGVEALAGFFRLADPSHLALAQIVSKGLSLFAGWSGGRLNQTRGKFIVSTVRLVVQQVEVMIVLLERQEDSHRMALRANDVPCATLTQGMDKVIPTGVGLAPGGQSGDAERSSMRWDGARPHSCPLRHAPARSRPSAHEAGPGQTRDRSPIPRHHPS